MPSFHLDPEHIAQIEYLVSYWNTIHMDSRNPKDYNILDVKGIFYSSNKRAYEVTLSSHDPVIESLEFTIRPEVYSDMMFQVKQKSNKPVKTTFHFPKHTPSTQPVVVVELVPIPTKYELNKQTFALKCNACTANRFWCEHVTEKFSTKGIFTASFIRKLRATDKGVYLAFPLFGLLYHRVHIQITELLDWQQKMISMVLIDPRVEGTSESYKDLHSFDIVESVRSNLATVITERPDSAAYLTDFINFARGDAVNLRCGSGHHGYGKIKELRNWLSEVKCPHPRYIALLWTLMMYKCCYFCWMDGEASLVVPEV